MDDRPIPPPEDDGPDIADASSLFDDTPAAPAKPAARPPSSAEVGGDYDVADVAESPPRRPAAPGIEEPRPARAPRAEPSPPSMSSRLERPATVEQVWSRGAEWGGTFVLMAVAVLGVLFTLYVLLQVEQYALAFVALVASAPLFLLVSYPILITLERPVRITPEQAVRDFYGALSHHFPHYRRMWLLLSSAGRVSGSFASFEGFRSYWKKRASELKSGRAGGSTPLKFQVDEFRSEKSAGLTSINATYTVNVFIRGRQNEGPVASVKVSASLVKGPDRMWYLDKGTLP